MEIKIVKFVEDPCFGASYEKIPQCTCCWIKKACLICYRNGVGKK